MNKTKNTTLKKLLSSFSSLSMNFLLIGLPITFLYLLCFLFIILPSDLPPNAKANLFSPSIEHIVMAFTVTVVGALTADIAERQIKKDDSR